MVRARARRPGLQAQGHPCSATGQEARVCVRRKRYLTTRKEGTHQLRHYYASITLAAGVSITELSEYLGHHDPAFTLRQYTHLLPNSFERAREAIDRHMGFPRVAMATEA
ncbi:tyrosine-type recombinase/integrase [Glycomyces sp. NEAU-7082]|uniref:Tyrosine-type recombinase/integrase n=1 Tax=Glycomyces albidus TaxID=2656774 RepID=A0A6L5GFU3_9ACTN|nr:tyrosine-type recombinase/integrase [Glycomyces albidus]